MDLLHHKYQKYKLKYLRLQQLSRNRLLDQNGGNLLLCTKNCGRYQNPIMVSGKSFTTCCSACQGPKGPHTTQCNHDHTMVNRNIQLNINLATYSHHLTICILRNVPQRLIDRLKVELGHIAGQDLLVLSQWWGPNSALVNTQYGVGRIHKQIADYISSFLQSSYGLKYLDTSRFASGFPPAHINLQGNQALFNFYNNKNVNYSLQI